MIKEKTEDFAKRLFDETSEKLGTEKFYIAGGALRSFVETPGLDLLNDGKTVAMSKDVDCFFNNAAEYTKSMIKLIKQGYQKSKERRNSVVMEKEGETTYDLVYLEWAFDGKSIIDDFDFTNCCVAYGKEGLTVGDTFFEDVQSCQLKINNVKIPYHTIQRAGKFIKKGYILSDKDKITLFENAANAPWGPYDEDEYMNPEEDTFESFSPSESDIGF